MTGFPRSVIEFQQRVADESACVKYLLAARSPEGFVCPGCGSIKAWNIGDRLGEVYEYPCLFYPIQVTDAGLCFGVPMFSEPSAVDFVALEGQFAGNEAADG